MGNGILPFGRGDSSSTLSKETLLFASHSAASTGVLSTPMSGSTIEDFVTADVTVHDEYWCFGWPILINLATVVLSSYAATV
jgi:hypothetical protein